MTNLKTEKARQGKRDVPVLVVLAASLMLAGLFAVALELAEQNRASVEAGDNSAN